MKTNPNRFWGAVLLLGWIFDFLFWKKALGVNFAIFITLVLVTGILLLRTEGLRLSSRSGWLLLPIVFFSGMTFLRLEPMTVFLSISMALFLLGVFSLTYLSGEWIRFALLDYVFGYLRLFGSMLARPIGFISENRRLLADQPVLQEKPGARLWPVLRGVVIALPIIGIFASLLSSADPIFATRLKDLISLFRIDNLPEYIFRLAYILILAYLLAGTFLHAAQKSDQKVEEKTWVSPFLGFTESTIVLGSLIALFVAFVVIQFQYFFGGQANISIEGYTYSEYARKGFGELVAVAFFSLLLLLGLGAITRRDSEVQRRTFSILGMGLVGLVIVMLVAAFQRLTLYEAAYGFSRLRTYTHVFMIWLGLLLVAVVALEAFRQERRVAFAMVLASIGFVVSLSLLNVDGFIVNQNVRRELDGATKPVSGSGRADLDAQYFVGLSDDAIPALVSAFHASSMPVPIKEKIGAALACKQYERKQNAHPYPWQSFHVSRWIANRKLQDVKKELTAYKTVDQDWPVKIQTPTGEQFPCSTYYD